MALHDLRKHGRTTRVRWHEHAELPGDDLMEKAVSAEALAHRVGEAGELDAVGAHDADAAELEALGEVEDGLAVDQGREGVIRCQSAGPHARKSVAEGKSVSVRVDIGGRRIIKKQMKHRTLLAQ